MYLKRSNVPKKWPLPRKGSKYLVRPAKDKEKGMPLLVIIRDVMGLAQNKKEVKKLMNMNRIKVNNKEINKVNYVLELFDVLDLNGKKFRLVLDKKKFGIEEVKGNANEKVVKVIGKKILKGGKLQLNLDDGRNYEFDKECKVGDSVIVDLKKSKIKKILPLEEGREILFIGGRHTGEKGEIENIDDKIEISIDSGKVEGIKENIMVIK